MVGNNSESGGGGGREGVLAAVAIAVVLFFVIKIYSDYVTATGQAVKPGSKRAAPSRSQSRRASAEEDPIVEPDRPANADDNLARDSNLDRPEGPRLADDKLVSDESPARKRTRRETDSAVAAADDARQGALPGQIVIEHVPGPDDAASTGRTKSRARRNGSPPPPRTLGGPEWRDTGATVRTAKSSDDLFRSGDPYPGTYNDIQVGDRLSAIKELRLPGGKLSRSLYSYHPRGGPFKTIYGLVTVGTSDPVVTGVVYLFRSSRVQTDVRRQAVETFGEGDGVLTDQGERRLWRHLGGYTVSIERDRYAVEQDLSAAGRRSHRTTMKKK